MEYFTAMIAALAPRLFVLALAFALAAGRVAAADRPNVVVVLTDDQGYGDLGAHGNPFVRTPNLDAFAAESVRFANFRVAPVCSPTRASLLTGRYNYRTGVVDTFIGRSMMHPDETTLAEVLRDAGYRTGIFGKWHLGDNHPLRAIDQGFETAVVHGGGGLTQPSDPPGNTYFDPILTRDGAREKFFGYCSDVYTDEATKFVARDDPRPFFVWLAFNCPHTPLQVREEDHALYRGKKLLPDDAAAGDVARFDAEATAKIYGMVTNIDDNLGRLFATLRERGLAENTIVVFLTDNGPQQPRYNAGMRGLKGTPYDGGIRVPFYMRWPARLAPGREVAANAAHIDLMPTLLDACGVAPPPGVAFDGRSLLPLATGASPSESWAERALHFQWHRGDAPEEGRGFAAVRGRWKLVQPRGAGGEPMPATPVEDLVELYDLEADPGETRDLKAERPEIAAALLAGYRAWFRDVGSPRGYDPPRIVLASEREPLAILSRQDWRGPEAGWGPKSIGHWEVEFREPARVRVVLRFDSAPSGAVARLRLAGFDGSVELSAGATDCAFELAAEPGPARLEPWIETPDGRYGTLYAEVESVRE